MLRSVLQESSVFQQGGRKVTSEEGGLPVMCPRGGTLCQSPAGEGTKRGCVVMQPHRKCLPEISCWPEGSPMLCLFEDRTKVPTECEYLTKEPLHWADAAPYGLVWHHMSHRLTPTWFSATGLVQLHTTTLESHRLALNPNCVTLGAGGSYNLLGSSVSPARRCVLQ